jgi:hypothetical protein
MTGCLLAVLTFFPIFRALAHFANPALDDAQRQSPVMVAADPAECSVQFNPVGTSRFTSSCDLAKAALVRRGVPYLNESAPSGVVAEVRIGDQVVPSYLGTDPRAAELGPAFDAGLASALGAAGYPAAADPARVNKPMVVLLLWVLMIYVTLVYGPIAAMLVEMFPTRIRYTSMSLPYHIGNGWFGGFLPATAFAIVAATGNIYSGLWYPVIIAGFTLVVGTLLVRETKDVDIAA